VMKSICIYKNFCTGQQQVVVLSLCEHFIIKYIRF